MANSKLSDKKDFGDILINRHFDEFDRQMGDEMRVGVAVIFANVGKSGPTGTDIDVKTVKTTFEKLQYAVFIVLDPTSDNILAISEFMAKEYPYERKIETIVIYYAGHGGSVDGNGYIIGVDHKKVDINKEIVSLFQPAHTKTIADRNLLFFFDCCLSSDDPQNEHQQAQSGQTKEQVFVPSYLPRKGKYLIAYATSVGEKSKGNFVKGGIWTSALFDNIKNYDLPITALLDKTWKDVVNKGKKDGTVVQGSHYISSLGTFFLRDHREEKITDYYQSKRLRLEPEESSQDTPVIVDIEEIMKATPDESDVLQALDKIKDLEPEWKEFGRRVNHTNLDLTYCRHLSSLLGEYYLKLPNDTLTWKAIIDALEFQRVPAPKPAIKYGNGRKVADDVRDYLHNQDVFIKYKTMLNSKEK